MMNKDKKQQGITIVSFLMVIISMLLSAVLVMRVFPSYVEYYKISKALDNFAAGSQNNPNNQLNTPADIRIAFQKQADIDSIESIKGSDLKIGSEKTAYNVTADYESRMPLFAEFYLVVHFNKSVQVPKSD